MHKVKKFGFGENYKTNKRKAGGNRTFLIFDIDFVDFVYVSGIGTLEIGGFNFI